MIGRPWRSQVAPVLNRRSALFHTAFLTLCLLFCAQEGVLAASPFKFTDYTSLHGRDRFEIQIHSGTTSGAGTSGTSAASSSRPEAAKAIGSGRILVLTPVRLEVEFRANPSGLDLEGRMDLRFIKETGEGILLHLLYSGRRNGLPDAGSERVIADRFLAENGILTFHFDGGRRFVQISRDSEGRNRFVTEWGSTLLMKRNGNDTK